MLLVLLSEIMSRPVKVLALRVCSRCATSSSENWIEEIRGKEGGGVVETIGMGKNS